MAKLDALADAAAGDYFGYAVAINGDTIVVGAHSSSSARPTAALRTNKWPSCQRRAVDQFQPWRSLLVVGTYANAAKWPS